MDSEVMLLEGQKKCNDLRWSHRASTAVIVTHKGDFNANS